MERIIKFIYWFNDDSIQTVDVNLEDELNDLNLDKNQALRRQGVNIKKITQELKEKENQMRVKVEQKLENNEKIDINHNDEDEDVEIDDI